MTVSVQIQRIGTEQMRVGIEGTAPLIVHSWSEKNKLKMLHSQQGIKDPKEPRDPHAEYEAAFYRLDDGTPGFPVLGFKAATVSAARFYGKDVRMTDLRQFLFFTGQFSGAADQMLTRIEGKPVIREDVVRIGMGGTETRYRPMFQTWATILTVTYVKSSLSRDSVLSLIDAAGFGVGVGEWRPEKSGQFGTFQVGAVEVVGG
jgi:hypothetical protein